MSLLRYSQRRNLLCPRRIVSFFFNFAWWYYAWQQDDEGRNEYLSKPFARYNPTRSTSRKLVFIPIYPVVGKALCFTCERRGVGGILPSRAMKTEERK